MTLVEANSQVHHGRLSSCLVVIACFLRGLPLFFYATPKTPLRVLCILAFNTLQVLRHSKPLTSQKIGVLAAVLDFAAYSNAILDRKGLCRSEYLAACKQLELAGIGSLIDVYLRQLWELELRRPAPGGDQRRFQEVRAYREAVVRLSLGMLAAVAWEEDSLEAEIRTIEGDQDLELLFKLVMQCQIIDDVLDYSQDQSAGLPSFLTASASLPLAMEGTILAVQSYSACRDRSPSAAALPLRCALRLVTALAQGMLWFRQRQLGLPWLRKQPGSVLPKVVRKNSCPI